jgi:hypothetical protein
LTSVQVITCAYANASAGTTTTTIYDIWTDGVYTTSTDFPGIIRDAFHRRRHKNRPILLARGQ